MERGLGGHQTKNVTPLISDKSMMDRKLDVEEFVLNTAMRVWEKVARLDHHFKDAEDVDHVVAKTDYLRTIPPSATDLLKILGQHSRCQQKLSLSEMKLGEFLDEEGKLDKSPAGRAMRVTGQFLIFISQSRKSLGDPVPCDSLMTFSNKAVGDALKTVEEMEKVKWDYRICRGWFKMASESYDFRNPYYRQKIKAIKTRTKQHKDKYEEQKKKTIQKVDLLSMSRCNLFSKHLTTYVDRLTTIYKEIACYANFANKMVQNCGSSQQLSAALQNYLGLDMVKTEESLEPAPEESQDLIEFISTNREGVEIESSMHNSQNEHDANSIESNFDRFGQYFEVLREFDPMCDQKHDNFTC